MSRELMIAAAQRGVVLIGAALLLGWTGASAQQSPTAAAPAATPPAHAATTSAPHKTFPPAEQGPFSETTTTQGKITVDLKGVWLLVVNGEMVAGKYKTFPQIFKITQAPDGLSMHLVDVLLPDDVAQSLKSNNQHAQAWQPDAAALKRLQQSWSTLPPHKMKALDEFLFAKIHYEIIAPDKFDSVIPRRDEKTDALLKQSKVAILVQEEYKPRDLGPDSRVAQMITRNTIYGITDVSKDTMKGTADLNFIAAGSGSPLPFRLGGPFVMYRLAQ